MQLKNYIKNRNTGSKNIKKSKNNDGTTIEIELVESFQNKKRNRCSQRLFPWC